MNFLFWLAGIAAVMAAARAVTHENPIYAALYTMLALGGVAVEFGLLHSSFLAAMQILLYAGAIMVLFVFVIMLLSLRKEEHGAEPPQLTKLFAALAALAIYAVLVSAPRGFTPRSPLPFPETDAQAAAS